MNHPTEMQRLMSLAELLRRGKISMADYEIRINKILGMDLPGRELSEEIITDEEE